jgi:hypothetical protein
MPYVRPLSAVPAKNAYVAKLDAVASVRQHSGTMNSAF